MISDSNIHIALSIWDLTDSYNRHAGATMLSILKNNLNANRKIIFHLLYDESLSVKSPIQAKYNKDKYDELILGYNAELQYHNIEADEIFYNLPATSIFTVATLFRLYLPQLLPKIDKILYLDCDVIVNIDIVELYDINIQNVSVAAVQEMESSRASLGWNNYYKSINVDVSKIFNAGVMLFNLKKIREEHHLLVEGISFFSHNPNTPYLDQDFLNWEFQNECLFLNERYNYYPTSFFSDEERPYNDCIIHYKSANRKPWKTYSGPIDDYYWKYLSETPWGKESGQLIKYARESTDRLSFIYSISSWIYRVPFKQQFKLLWQLSGDLWIKLVKIYFKELMRRL